MFNDSHENMAENPEFQKGNRCLFCVAEESSQSESEDTPPYKWMMLMPNTGTNSIIITGHMRGKVAVR